MIKVKNSIHLLKRLSVFGIPFFFIVVAYIVIDPFMVLFKYDDYNKNTYIPKNRDFVSTEVYLENERNLNYDSFIFGSSTALFMPPSIWQNHLKDSNKIFSFDASAESIAGIWSKINFINKRDQKLRNALILIDCEVTFNDQVNDNALFLKHYKVSNSSRLKFQYKHFMRFLDPNFIRAYISYNLTQQFKPFMNDYLINEISHIDPISNEYHNLSIAEELKKDSIKYYENRKDKFPIQTGKYYEENDKIKALHIMMLKEINEIFINNNTHYKIIIVPNYRQIYFNKSNLNLLRSIFKEDCVFDFSGINRYSKNQSNFYDAVHFKKYLGKELLDVAYQRSDYLLQGGILDQ